MEIQKGFALGEWDYKFDKDSVQIKNPAGAVATGKVSQANGIIEITTDDGKQDDITVVVSRVSLGASTPSARRAPAAPP